MTKTDAIERITKLKDRVNNLTSADLDGEDFKKWHRDTEIAIGRILGEKHKTNFTQIKYSRNVYFTSDEDLELRKAYKQGIQNAIDFLDACIYEINEFWEDDEIEHIVQLSTIEKIKLLIERFDQIARQLCIRHKNRNTLKINDEYDVQDLFHALLTLYFEDIRPEEYTPSYAGSASRVDFLLKEEKIIIEIKKTRKGLGAKEVGEQLLIDSQKYQVHPDCKQLICFVYDPGKLIRNPRGLENDLTGKMNDVPVSVIITP